MQTQPTAGTKPAPSSSPLIIGVTAHRNLAEADLERTRTSVAAFFDAIRQLLPDTQLIVMLGMAADGDLMVAETALSQGLSVSAVLPLPLADFVLDFDDRGRQRLTDLLSHRNLDHAVLPPDATGSRDAAYRNLAEVLIRKSDLMLALWDGQAPQRADGTADTVLRCLRIRTDEGHASGGLAFTAAAQDADTDSPFVYWIPVAPGGNTDSMTALSPCFLTGLGDALLKFSSRPPEGLRRRLVEFNDYNRDYRSMAAALPSHAGSSLMTDLPAGLGAEVRQALQRIDVEYGRADALALHYQKRSDSLFGMFGVFAFVMGCIYLVYDKLGENRIVLLAYLVILLTSITLYRLLYSKIWFVKHLRYRALAESLRVMFYLNLAGVDRGVDATEVLALSGIEHFEGFGWIGYVLKNVDRVSTVADAPPDPRRGEHVRRAWVDDQYRYFSRKVKQLEERSRRVSRWQRVVIAVTVVVLVTRMLFSDSVGSLYVLPGVPLKNLLMLGAGVTALFLGAWKLHQGKMATRELIWQYKNQLAHFARSSAALERTTMPERQTEILVELGKRSLMESYLWTIHRYHREHAPPAGG